MSWIAKAGLAAALLYCGQFAANAEDAKNGQWLKDGDCALFSADAAAGDAVKWSGGCDGGFASGIGTATFIHNGETQSFTALFDHGAITDGHVITSWGEGWSFDGDTVDGRFNGGGVLTTAAADRFEGLWVDGKMTGFGILRRANGERYAGDWKDDKPNGAGELRHADGTLVAGNFIDGKLTALAQAETPALVKASVSDAARAPFSTVSGKSLTGVDGSSITLTLIEGGMELQVMPSDASNGSARKTTFTFMTDRMGTVVEDTGAPSAGSSVTGFFRLTPKGVEVRYADGRSAMLSANGDGGVQMTLDGDTGPACRAWYPAGHSFTETEKKAALNAYASKLGLAVSASDTSCGTAPTAVAPAGATAPAVPAPKARTARAEARPAQGRIAKASYHVGDYGKPLETVAVKTSEVHAIDGDAPAIAVPAAKEVVAAIAPKPSGDRNDASHCLKVDSDGSHWGFRNACDFAVQFAYCMAGGDAKDETSLTACSKDVITSVSGSVAAGSFGALMTDNSISEKDGAHNFRWIACAGGAGEVVAHLDHSEPPAGRCERARTASN